MSKSANKNTEGECSMSPVSNLKSKDLLISIKEDLGYIYVQLYGKFLNSCTCNITDCSGAGEEQKQISDVVEFSS